MGLCPSCSLYLGVNLVDACGQNSGKDQNLIGIIISGKAVCVVEKAVGADQIALVIDIILHHFVVVEGVAKSVAGFQAAGEIGQIVAGYMGHHRAVVQAAEMYHNFNDIQIFAFHIKGYDIIIGIVIPVEKFIFSF